MRPPAATVAGSRSGPHSGSSSRETEKQARDYYEYVIEQNGDVGVLDGVDHAGAALNGRTLRDRGAPGYGPRAALAAFGTQQLIGTPDSIAQRFAEFSELGLDGAVMVWPNYEEGVDAFNEHVIPRLEQLGIRKPFTG